MQKLAKGKTLEEVEEEEGGTIKESRVPMAQTFRAQQRKGKSKGTQPALPLPSSQQCLSCHAVLYHLQGAVFMTGMWVPNILLVMKQISSNEGRR